ncbi:addiction module component [Photobacterium kishitanii]|uniref:Addiction module component n=1 Tax=Photobacterium kishitanii TaxID=318456 RepID=A0AAX0YRR0_9GAMM|nr:addiction module component [Photobacterium kishitanii]PSV14176.1 addiction module component [Photobacterium kishitanii]PSX19129.1 addiction module component [Photobacterium kishitanii]PSX28924.1 addiction module component [Photobacterium kishitanii]PSX34572.1 addiction module component [Photobacterium kishitanii]PSX43828.1 addiction module component [Photobacterium kishitanii]
MKNFKVTYVVSPHFDVPCQYSINAASELDSHKTAQQELEIRYPNQKISIITISEA